MIELSNLLILNINYLLCVYLLPNISKLILKSACNFLSERGFINFLSNNIYDKRIDVSYRLHVCRGHKYQMFITHKIYLLRGSFPKLTNSLSLKMYSCLIKNEKIILGRLHKVYKFIGSIRLRASSSTSSSSM